MDILDAYAVLQRCTQLVKEKQQSGFAFAILQDISRRLIYEVSYDPPELPQVLDESLKFGLQRPLNLVEEGRELVREGPVTLHQKPKKKHFLFLLNNLLIICKASSKHADRYKVLEVVEGRQLEAEELGDAGKSYFRVTTPSSKFEFVGRTAEETSTWVKEINQARSKNKVYGVPLADLTQRESSIHGIPVPVVYLIKYLRQNGMLVQASFFFLTADLFAPQP
jgi:hypothetical protein